MKNKYIILGVLSLLVWIWVLIYITHRSVPQQITQENIELKQILESTSTWSMVLKKWEFNPNATDSDRFHRGEWSVQIVSFEGKYKVVFWDDFVVTNGPDYYMYLLEDGDVQTKKEFIQMSNKLRLSQIKQFKWYQVYEIPNDLDIDNYHSIVIWCDMFGAFITSADLQ